MSDENPYGFPTGGIHRRVARYIAALPDLAGKLVVDIPCGDGRTTHEFLKKGAAVRAFDLNPAFMKVKEVKVEFADLCEPLPVESGTADFVVCQEGIEHLPDPLKTLQEFNRILKKGGKLLLTTPNYSHLRARLMHFLIESPNWDRMPCSELDAVWFSNHDAGKVYFGHLFLLNVQRLRTLAAVSGFRLTRRLNTNLGRFSLVLAVLLYPALLLANLLAWAAYRRRIRHVPPEEKDRVFRERIALNLSATTLLGKHTFWELEKELDRDEVREKLRRYSAIQPDPG
jgi:SAM-dependent methyltransferase